MKKGLSYLKTFKGSKVTGEEGQGLVEYSMIILLIAIVVIIALDLLGVDIRGLYENITNKMEML